MELNFTMSLRALNNALATLPPRKSGTSSPGDGSKQDAAEQIVQSVWARSEPLPLTTKNAKVALATTLLK